MGGVGLPGTRANLKLFESGARPGHAGRGGAAEASWGPSRAPEMRPRSSHAGQVT